MQYHHGSAPEVIHKYSVLPDASKLSDTIVQFYWHN